MNDPLPSFTRIYNAVRTVPSGRVASYRDIAVAAGLSKSGARVVGWALRDLPESNDVPWWRVVNQKGVLSIVNPKVDALEQRRCLEKEGIIVEEHAGSLRVQNPPWISFKR